MGKRTLIFLLLLILVTGCTASPSTPTPAPTLSFILPAHATDHEAILALLRAESRGVVNQDIDLLAMLWSEDAVVVDAKHTPENPLDDTRWEGIDAVLDRYVTLVFPGNPQFAEPGDVTIVVTGEQAEAVSTTQIGEERSPAGDRWTFVKRNGRWWIQSLTYNLEPD
ncbi:MAG TPA: DUF4440 domain-containing protein [Anaerolineae bacterium]|nr:DUF4440 domain-containing protein [Anaerolineae bacterium]